MDQDRFNALEKLESVFPESSIMSLKILTNDAITRTKPEKDHQIESPEYNDRLYCDPWLYQKEHSHKEDDHQDAGDNLTNRKKNTLDKGHDVPKLLIQFCGIPSQEESIGAHGISHEKTPAEPMTEPVGIPDPNHFTGNASYTCYHQHQDRERPGHDQQVIGIHRGKKVQEPTSKRRLANTIRIGGQSKEGKDRSDADKLEQCVEKDQPKNGKQLQPPVGKREPVTAGEELKK
jgi:hypothetical protein